MAETIKDGTGKGFLAEIDSLHRLHTKAITEIENKFVNEINEDSYLYFSDITPTGANDIFGYLKNTSDKDMFINWYRLWTASSAEAVDVYVGYTGTPGGTTINTPTNMNIASSNSPEGDFFEGVDITGLSGGTILDRLRISGDGKDVVDSYPGSIILQKSATLIFRALNGAIPLELTVNFYYK